MGNTSQHDLLYGITCHPTQVNALRHNPCSQPGLYSIYLPRKDRRLSIPRQLDSFSTQENEANIIIYYYLVPCHLSIDPKYVTLNDCNGPNGHFTLNVHYYELPFSNYLLLYLL